LQSACIQPAGHILKSLSREYRLLFRSVRLGLYPEDEDDLQGLLRAGIDWDLFVHLLHWHRLVPQAYAALQRLGPEALPAPIRHALQAHVQHNLQCNLALAAELVRLVQRLREHDIRVLPLKGPTLAVYAYGNLGLRHAGDLDILVPRQALRQTIQVLQGLGYDCLQERLVAFNASQEAAYLAHSNEWTFRCDARHMTVDLHWAFERLRQLFPTDIDTIWSRLTSLELAGTAVPCLPDEELLLYLGTHGSKHMWMRLCWLYDVATLVHRRPGLHWQQLLQQAATWRTLRPLLHGVVLAHQLFGSALPAPLQQQAQHDPMVARLGSTVYGTLTRPLPETSAPQGLSALCRNLLYVARLQASWRHKLTVGAGIMKPVYVTDWQAVPLPAALFPLYYVIRPLRLLGKYLAWWR